jgi:hypothetical protein
MGASQKVLRGTGVDTLVSNLCIAESHAILYSETHFKKPV